MRKFIALILLISLALPAFAWETKRNPKNGIERVLEKMDRGPKTKDRYLLKSDQFHYCNVNKDEFTNVTIGQAFVCKSGWYWLEMNEVIRVSRSDAH